MPATRTRRAIDQHLEAMRHPLRQRCWQILHTRIASPKEMAEELGAPIENVSHHTKRLVQLGCAELVDKRQVRGAIEHFYRATKRVLIDEEDWARLLDEEPRLAEHLLGTFMQSQLDDYVSSVEAGVLGSDDRWHLSRDPGVVDAQGLDEALELAKRVQEEFAAIVQGSAARRSESGEDAIPMSMCLAFFKVPRRQ